MTDDATEFSGPDSACSDHPDGCPDASHASADSETLADEAGVETDEDLKGTFQDESNDPLPAPAPASKVNAAAPAPTPPAPEPEPEPEPEPTPVAPQDQDQELDYGPGDLVFIHSNSGKYIAEVKKGYPNYDAAEADFELSFQTIVKKGPLYDYSAPHYLCHLANPSKSPVGACVLDTTLKARCED